MSSMAIPKTTGQLVGEIWRKALGPKARDTSGVLLEFSVGLQRLLRFLEDIEKTFGVKIRPTIAMQLGSVDAIAQAIDTNVWPMPSSCVMMRDGDESETLFIVSAGSGVVLELCDLAQLVTFPGKIIGLQLPGLAGESEPLTSIPAIAEYYKEIILRYAGAGKIHVIGYSFGGLVTMELARVLKRDGQRLGLVGVLDSTCYEKYWPKAEWLKVAVSRIQRKVNAIKKSSSVGESFSFAAHCIAIAKVYLKRRLRPSKGATVAEESAYYIGGLDTCFQNVRNAAITAFEAYNPSFYDGKIVLFKSEFGDPNACNPVSIWKRKVTEMKLVHVPGTHGTMIRKPFVQILADQISASLAA